MNDAWQDNSTTGILQYDFQPPAHWSRERIAAEQAAIAALLEDADAGSGGPGWLQLARCLPGALRETLIAELRAGNRLAGIGSSGWPGDGSIVVNLRERFATARRMLPPGVVWRELNDPHYAAEELSQTVGPVEFLMIC